MKENRFEQDLDRNAANFVPLTPVSFIDRAAQVYPDYPSIIDGARRFTWGETFERCRRFVSALKMHGVEKGDCVSIIAPNIPAIYEASFAVPMHGAVLNTINTRLDAATIAFILDHAQTRLLLVDREYSQVVMHALESMQEKPIVVSIDGGVEPKEGEGIEGIEYEDFLAAGDPEAAWCYPDDEWRAISLNYTSGTTGNPKGVVYHHRGAYLNALSNVVVWNLNNHPVYLWTLPMFHCNGWCFPWTLAAVGGTSVCLRKVQAGAIYRAIDEERVTHLCGAPIVIGTILDATEEERRDFSHPVRIMTAAAPPPAAVLARIESEGFEVTHAYGLTETYGPAVFCAWKDEWNDLPADERAQRKSRQGVRYHALDGLQIMNPDTMQPVPADGKTLGEVMFRGNIVMKGYLKNPAATREALAGGWFHSGDLGVVDPDGYIRLKDRSKDIIISGGENISSIEIEDVLYRHPAISEAAVVACPDEKWGETPCAFITLRPNAQSPDAKEIIDFCRERLAHYKVPRRVVFGPLPKTSTGKIRKFNLRERAAALVSDRRASSS
ncbi:acyl-CoA synthetase [Thioalkalivibrio sp. HK1]|uniref:acyl-CoA synthetase n=1 Tax=Thioalkalivibrio sp. HK1 TaxID=1469245 RepID=UPI00047074CA|nr:acyl-CoA synthetase [Thioalkalivibrio sp. HK1]